MVHFCSEIPYIRYFGVPFSWRPRRRRVNWGYVTQLQGNALPELFKDTVEFPTVPKDIFSVLKVFVVFKVSRDTAVLFAQGYIDDVQSSQKYRTSVHCTLVYMVLKSKRYNGNVLIYVVYHYYLSGDKIKSIYNSPNPWLRGHYNP